MSEFLEILKYGLVGTFAIKPPIHLSGIKKTSPAGESAYVLVLKRGSVDV